MRSKALAARKRISPLNPSQISVNQEAGASVADAFQMAIDG